MRILIDNQKTTLFLPGDDLPREKNSLWIIYQGVVKTYTYSQCGTPITLGFWGKDDLVGSAITSRCIRAKPRKSSGFTFVSCTTNSTAYLYFSEY